MRRREFIAGLSGAVAVPLVAEAQQAGMPIIGYLGSESPERYGIRLEAFTQGLSAMGYDEGRNVMVEYRWAGGQADRLPALAADLVGRRVDVISVPGSVVAALAAKAATETIPIVFEMGLDPVAVNLVSSLSKPEANVTGITSLNVEVGPKRLQLLHELLPVVKHMAVLINPTNQLNAEITIKGVRDPARAMALALHLLNASTEREFETALASLAQLQIGALIVGGDIFFIVAHNTWPRCHSSTRSQQSWQCENSP